MGRLGPRGMLWIALAIVLGCIVLWRPVLPEEGSPSSTEALAPAPGLTASDSIGGAILQVFQASVPAEQDDAAEVVIGFSQAGRPLVVRRLGTGPTAVFVMGGQHGGPEANTVRLARQLLSYFEERTEEVPAG